MPSPRLRNLAGPPAQPSANSSGVVAAQSPISDAMEVDHVHNPAIESGPESQAGGSVYIVMSQTARTELIRSIASASEDAFRDARSILTAVPEALVNCAISPEGMKKARDIMKDRIPVIESHYRNLLSCSSSIQTLRQTTESSFVECLKKVAKNISTMAKFYKAIAAIVKHWIKLVDRGDKDALSKAGHAVRHTMRNIWASSLSSDNSTEDPVAVLAQQLYEMDVNFEEDDEVHDHETQVSGSSSQS